MNATREARRLSVAIITLNEEHNLPRCLASLPSGAEVVVLDSGSTDGTRAVSERHGVRFVTQAFQDHAQQKNAAVALTTRPWVLSIDADEELTPALREAVVAATERADAAAPSGYRLRRRLVFMGRRMRFGKTSDRPLRLFQREAGRFESMIHERVVLANGTAGVLEGELLHYSYANLDDYFRRFNSYTSRIAENHERQGRPMPPLVTHALRPWGEFVARYVLRCGFLDGYPGYTYALLSSLYGYVKYAKLRERLASPAIAAERPEPAS